MTESHVSVTVYLSASNPGMGEIRVPAAYVEIQGEFVGVIQRSGADNRGS